LQNELTNNPELGDLMPGTGGFRKLRWADKRRGKGREAVFGLFITTFLSDQQIWSMTLYDKNEASDLTPREKKALQAAIAAELKMRETRRARKK